MIILSAMKLPNSSPLEDIGILVEDEITFPSTIQFHKSFSCEKYNTILESFWRYSSVGQSLLDWWHWSPYIDGVAQFSI